MLPDLIYFPLYTDAETETGEWMTFQIILACAREVWDCFPGLLAVSSVPEAIPCIMGKSNRQP